MDFNFPDLYQFLISALGMILSFLAGRSSKKIDQTVEKDSEKDK